MWKFHCSEDFLQADFPLLRLVHLLKYNAQHADWRSWWSQGHPGGFYCKTGQIVHRKDSCMLSVETVPTDAEIVMQYSVLYVGKMIGGILYAI